MTNPIANAQKAISQVIEYEPEELETVWFAYILGGWKTLQMVPSDPGLYIEATYNKAKGETYVDIYEKVANDVVVDDPIDKLKEHLEKATTCNVSRFQGKDLPVKIVDEASYFIEKKPK